MKRIIALLLCLVMTMALLTGCGEKSGVKKLLGAYEDACQTLDVEAMAECFNPTIVDPVMSILGVFGIELSDLNSLLSSIVSFADDYGEAQLEELYQSMKIKPTGYVFNEAKDECDVSAEVSFTVDGTQKSEIKVFHCELVDEAWYIFSMK